MCVKNIQILFQGTQNIFKSCCKVHNVQSVRHKKTNKIKYDRKILKICTLCFTEYITHSRTKF